jgi:hypothetical protein
MQRPSRVDLVEQLKKAHGLPPGKGETKTIGYLSRKDLVEMLAFLAELRAEKNGELG